MIAAGLWAALLVLAHGVGGERTNLRRLAGTTVPDGDKIELRIGWHLFTWHLLLAAVVLLSGRGHLITVSQFLAASFLGSGVLFFALAARSGLGALVRHPQWVALLLLGSLIAWGAR